MRTIDVAVVSRLENFLRRIDAELDIINELQISISRPIPSYIQLIKDDKCINLFLIQGMHNVDGHNWVYYVDLTERHEMTQLTEAVQFFVQVHVKKIELYDVKNLFMRML